MLSLSSILSYVAPVAAQTAGGLMNRKAAGNATNSLATGVRNGMAAINTGAQAAEDALMPYSDAGKAALQNLTAGTAPGGDGM